MYNGSKPYRIFRVISRLNVGGPSYHVIWLTSRLHNDGEFQSILVSGFLGEGEGDMNEYAAAHGVRPLLVPELRREIRVFGDIRALWKLYCLFRSERPAIVHTHTAKAGTLGRLAAKLAGVPIVIHTFHGNVFKGYFSRWKVRFFVVIERMMAWWTDAIIVLSPEQQREILDYKIGRPEQVRIIPLGIDLERFLHGRKGKLKSELALKDDSFLIGIVGRLTPIKNHSLFLLAAKRILQKSKVPVYFVVIGDGELHASLVKESERIGLAGYIFFLGWRQDLPDIYQDLDALVLTSNNEGTPLSLIEAMASGCLTVATRVGGVPDIVKHEETGLLVDANDDEVLSEQVLRILNDKDLAVKIKKAAQRFVFQNFGIDRLENDIRGLYCELLEDGPFLS